MTMLWVTRGRNWGFRFLRDGGLADPLPEYERAFAGVPRQGEICEPVGDAVTLRLLDPENRADGAGRLITHEFVLTGEDARGVTSVADGLRLVWPRVADEYAQLWRQA